MNGDRELSFVHRFVPAVRPGDAPTLLILHGHGAHENHLVPLARMLAPAANVLSPLGKVVEDGKDHRWWSRRQAGEFDRDEVLERTAELAAFLAEAIDTYRLRPERIVGAGLSAGAHAALALALLHPQLVRGVVAFKPVMPFDPDPPPDLGGTEILIVGARQDEFIPVEVTEGVAQRLQEFGADVDLRWGPFGHLLSYDDVVLGQTWVRAHLPWLATDAPASLSTSGERQR